MVIPISTEENQNNTQKEYQNETEKEAQKLDQIDEADEDFETKAAEYLEQLQRLQAEFSNYRKRVEKERETLFTVAKGEMILNLLSVLDDFERMVNHHAEKEEYSLDGVRLIYQKLKKILIDEGLEEITSIGQRFNPEFHEAVDVEETNKEHAGLVMEEWQKGYRFGGKLLRPSRVKVGKHIEKKGDSGDGDKKLL